MSGQQRIAGARVRIQGSDDYVLSDDRGCFELRPNEQTDAMLAAWKPGYFIGLARRLPGQTTIALRRLPEHDASDYRWVDPAPGADDAQRCGNCHAEIYEQWQAGSHASSATNRRFLSLYAGTTWDGTGQAGWSLLDDYPLGAGVCASCHAPSLEAHQPGQDDLRQTTGVAAQGVHCDFCHKIQQLLPAAPGIAHGRLAVQLLRPAEGQLFFGPLEDATRGEETYSSLMKDSRYCATCHEGIVFGVHVYGTYSEWLQSPAKRVGQSCQSCHMQPDGQLRNIAPGAGGIERDPATLASHQLLPGGKAAMLARCLQVAAEWITDDAGTRLRITITAENVGHRVPTGFVDRHLILHVLPVDGELGQSANGGDLSVIQGPLLPDAAGPELAGRPGRLFGRLLTSAAGDSPAPFWHTIAEQTDTRLEPGRPVKTEFRLAPKTRRVRVQLWYRRFWEQVRREKQWPDETIVVYDETLATPRVVP